MMPFDEEDVQKSICFELDVLEMEKKVVSKLYEGFWISSFGDDGLWNPGYKVQCNRPSRGGWRCRDITGSKRYRWVG